MLVAVATDRGPVLLVEDNDLTRDAVARLLELRGYRVIQARDGLEAWEYLEHGGRAFVIVLDLSMPRFDGYAFRARQLTHAEHAGIPVIIFTANDGVPASIGSVRVVRKLDPDRLVRLVDETTGCPS